MNGLEEIVENKEKVEPPDYTKSLQYRVKDWAASATGGLVAFTPLMAPIEYFCVGMDGWETARSRAISAAAIIPGMILYQKVRKKLADSFHVYSDQKWRKRLVNALSYVPVHPPVYAMTLNLSGASLNEMNGALPKGLAVAMVTSPFVAPFLEWWRSRVWGMPKTYQIKKVEETMYDLEELPNKMAKKIAKEIKEKIFQSPD